MAQTQFNTQSNPQQNPVYQRQQQIVGTLRPQGPVQTDPTQQKETFLQRQQRRYGQSPDYVGGTQGQQTAQPTARPPASSVSPVTPNGKLSMQPATPVNNKDMRPGGGFSSTPMSAQDPNRIAALQGLPTGSREQQLADMNAAATAFRANRDPATINYNMEGLQTALERPSPQRNAAALGQVATQPGTPTPGGGVAAPPLQYAQQAPPAATPPQGSDPFGGRGVWTGSGWVPNDHPLAQGVQQPGAQPGQPAGPQTQFLGLPQLPANATYTADNLGNDPFSTYQQHQFNTQGLPTYNSGQINAPQLQGYTPGQISQFQGPNSGPIDAQTQALISSILGNPLSMSDQNVAALKERQKESALSQQRQLMESAQQNAASRGLAPGSGNLATQERRVGDATLASLLGSGREIDLAKMTQDQSDRMAAAGLGDQFLSSQMQRATQGYGATLAGQQAREQAGQAQADDAFRRAGLDVDVQGRNLDENFRGYQTQADARRFGFDVEQAQAGENQVGFKSRQDAELNALQRSVLQSGVNQKAADSGLQGFQTMMDAYNAQQGRGLEGRQLDISEKLGQGGLDLDRSKLTETGRQFDKGYQLDFLNYLLNRDQMGQQNNQFNSSLGLDWAKFNANDRNALLGLLP